VPVGVERAEICLLRGAAGMDGRVVIGTVGAVVGIGCDVLDPIVTVAVPVTVEGAQLGLLGCGSGVDRIVVVCAVVSVVDEIGRTVIGGEAIGGVTEAIAVAVEAEDRGAIGIGVGVRLARGVGVRAARGVGVRFGLRIARST